MKLAIVSALALAALPVVGGCTLAGEEGTENHARANARTSIENTWDARTPKGDFWIDTNPDGADIEMLGRDGEWVLVATTPMANALRLEATGRPYSFRITKPGFLPRTARIALNPNNSGKRLTLELEPDSTLGAE